MASKHGTQRKNQTNGTHTTKHLDELEKDLNWIERREDTESGKYPYPVLYKATRSTASYGIYIKTVFDNADQIEEELKETKDPYRNIRGTS